MKKRLSTIVMSLLLGLVLLASPVSNAFAQTPATDGVVTLADLGKTEISLRGPYDTSTTTFGLPANWKFTGDAKISLNITTSFNTSFVDGEAAAIGGILTISFNRSTVATLVLNQVGNFTYEVAVPARYLDSARVDGLMELRYTLDSGGSCVADQNMNVIVNPSTSTTFTYEEQQPSTDLSAFPRPIVQSTIYPDLALVVVPDEPTATELQSAFTVAAGFGNIAANRLGLDLVTVSQLTDEQKTATHLIFVGKAASLPTLTELDLPLEVTGGSFAFPEGGQDNGVVQMANSPWAIKNVVMVVSGNTDLGTLKAAQAVSTGVFQANTAPNLAVVESVQDAVPAPMVADQSFADMGYTAGQFTSRGVDSQFYNFYLPSGSTLSSDAYLDLAYGNSSLLNYDTSGLVVFLNSQPIGSVRFSDETAGQAVNRIRISVPAAAAIPGENRIEVRSSLEPLDNCTDPNLRGLWAVVWPESKLHLPFTPTQFNNQMALDLSAYPSPMVYDSTLGTTAVVVQRNDVGAWRKFVQAASYLGDRSNGAVTKLAVFYDDEAVSADLADYNVIVVGRPSQLAVMDQLNSVLPVPFEPGSDMTQGDFLQVTYQIPPEVPVGYVELLPSPWNEEKALIAALGNTPEGVAWGISALVDPVVRSQLAGNVAVINNTQVQAIDTRLMMPSIPEPVQANTAEAPEDLPEPIVPTDSRPVWLLPALIIAVVLILVVILVAILSNFRSNRKPG